MPSVEIIVALCAHILVSAALLGIAAKVMASTSADGEIAPLPERWASATTALAVALVCTSLSLAILAARGHGAAVATPSSHSAPN